MLLRYLLAVPLSDLTVQVCAVYSLTVMGGWHFLLLLTWQKEARAQVLVDRVFEYVNVMERDYFSCTYETNEGKVSFGYIHVQYSSLKSVVFLGGHLH